MTIKTVLFDFSGTLLRIEPAEEWLRGALAATGHVLPEARLVELAAALERVGAQPGGAPGAPVRFPDARTAELWPVRDESAAAHRAAYTGLSRHVPLPHDALHEELYARHMRPEGWRPYPDAHDVLAGLRARGIRVGVVSNVGWDIRPVFRAHGLDAFVDAYTLSFEHGVQKPDARLFATACGVLGASGPETLMVGDSREADGGASALGCAVHFVEHLPVTARPAGLRPVLGLVDAAG
ncbi:MULTISPECIES: HAD-IA family hydrolase [unclassified Streptomyces]|uniref:HAD family hydrolase n=1 Tax=unclassified Streptomyces TaxID=2593676 RepID=UPI00081DFD04|nr:MULTISPECIES: HAD-IA family hydrolase [unclassified Streptomyces]MYR25563.1 HAD-IA family hydrolase [Streptomyces sp. SID4945]NJA56635.1 HAD-IA family hydrolase [Streptomyces sp. NEAU-H3]SCE84065.1 putative hydrolase of the HAD superfamily [Streptomyces sp. LcepLS]